MHHQIQKVTRKEQAYRPFAHTRTTHHRTLFCDDIEPLPEDPVMCCSLCCMKPCLEMELMSLVPGKPNAS